MAIMVWMLKTTYRNRIASKYDRHYSTVSKIVWR